MLQHSRRWALTLLMGTLISIGAHAVTRTWDNGGGDGLWSTAANWSGDVTPTSADAAVFNATSTANCTIDVSPTVQSITIDAAYTGIVGLGANTLTVSAGFAVATATAFDGGTGLLKLTGTMTVNSAASVYNLQISSGNNSVITLTQDVQVNNTLTLDAIANLNLSGASKKINVNGNVSTLVTSWPNNGNLNFISLTGSTDQTINGTGSLYNLNIAKTGGDVLMPAGVNLAYDGQLSGAGYLKNTGGMFRTLGNATLNFTGQIDDLQFSGNGSVVILTQDVQVLNTLTIDAIVLTLSNNTKKIKVNGNISNLATNWGNLSAAISLTGNTDQTISGTGLLYWLDVSKTGGNVLLANIIPLMSKLTGSGWIKNAGGVLQLYGNPTVDFSGQVDDVRITGSSNITLTQDLQVLNTLTLDALNNFYLNGSNRKIKVNGNVSTAVASWANTGNLNFISLTGSTDQTISGTGSLFNLNIAKTGGDVLMPVNLNLAHDGQLTGTGYLKNTGGVFRVMSNATLNFSGQMDDMRIAPGNFSTNVVILTQDVQVLNTLTLDAIASLTLSGNTKKIKVNGNISTLATNWGNLSAAISLTGNTDQTISGTGLLYWLDVSKTGGNVLLANIIPLMSKLTGSGWIKNAGGVLQLYGNPTVDFSGQVDDVRITGSGNIPLTQDLQVLNTLTLDALNNFYLNGSNKKIKVNGNVSTAVNSWANTGNLNFISLTGSTDQTISGTGSLFNLNIAKTGGDVLMAADVNMAYDGQLTGTGYLKNTGGVLRLTGNVTLNFGGQMDDLRISSGNNSTVILAQDVQVNNTLTLDVFAAFNLSGAGRKIKVNGNVSNGISFWSSFTSAAISLVGNTNQTITGAGTFYFLDVSKTGGDVLMPVDVNIYGGSLTGTGLFKNMGGVFHLISNVTLNFSGQLDDLRVSSPVLTLTQDIQVNNTLALGAIANFNLSGAGKKIKVNGNVSTLVTSWPNNGNLNFISLTGSTNQTISGTGSLYNLNISKTGGDVLMAADVNMAHDGQLTGTGYLKNTGGVFRLMGNATLNFSGQMDDMRIAPGGFSTNVVILTQDVQVLNTLTLDAIASLSLNGSGKKIKVNGNVSTLVTGWPNNGNLNFISLTGSTDQTISGTGSLYNLNISKTGGDVLMPVNLNMAHDGQLTGTGYLKNTGGVFRVLNNATLNFAGQIDDLRIAPGGFSTNIIILTQDVQVLNTLTLDAIASLTLSGSGKKIKVNGNVNTGVTGWTGSSNAAISLTGNTNQTIDGAGSIRTLDVAKASGLVLMNTASIRNGFAAVTVSAGSWDVNGYTITSSGGFTTTGGKITGTGTLAGAVTCNTGGGGMAPGNSPACITINGNLIMNSGSTLTVEINGTTPCTQHDQLIVNGTVTLNNPTLNTSGATVILPSAITIIDNNLTDAVSGTFVGQANNSSITLGGNPYRVTYNGGTGNDVTLGSFQEINVKGNSISIADGDNTPSATDDTDFGNITVGAPSPKTYTIQNLGTLPLSVTGITVTGAQASEFVVSGISFPASISGGGSLTFVVTFTPTTTGTRNATINVANDDSDEATYDFSVRGTGFIPGAALNFDGVNDEVDAGNISFLNGATAFTVESWVKRTTTTQSFPIFFSKSPTSSNTNAIQLGGWAAGSPGIFARISGASDAIGFSTANLLPLDTWAHVAVVFNGTGTTNEDRLKIYVDGEPVSLTFSGTIPSSVPNVSMNATIGANPVNTGNNSNRWKGDIDEMRIWNLARSCEEIRQLRNCELSGSESGLVSYYKFNQGNAGGNNAGLATATDAAGGDNDGTLTNFALSGATSNWVTPGGVTTGTSCPNTITYPEANVKGNSVSITDGDATASAGDHSDFGQTTGAPIIRTFTLENTGTSTLSVSTITLTGANAAMFAVSGISLSATVSAGGTATFNVTYTPTGAGIHNATVNIASNDCDEAAYDFAIKGEQTCSPPAFTACPANQSANAAAGQCSATVSYTATTSGTPSPAYTYSFSGATTASGSGTGSGSTFNKGVTTVTITATNACGAPTCVFTVTVNDTQAPTVTCAANVTVSTTAGLCTGTTTLSNPSATDNCSAGGNSLHFDGVNDYISAPLPMTAITNITIEAWIKPTSFPAGFHSPVSYSFDNGSVGNGIDILLLGNELLVHHPGGGGGSSGYFFPAANQWYHVALVRNGNVSSIYVNGVQAPNSYTGVLPAPTDFRIGSQTGIRYFEGNIDEVRLWNVVRTPAQILSTMNTELVGNETGLTGFYKFNQGTPGGNNAGLTTAFATTGSNGTLINFALTGATSNWSGGQGPTLNFTNNAPATYPTGNSIVTWTVTDVAGNSATCTQTVTVTDNTPPTAICQDITVQLNASGNASITTAQINNGSSDACGIANVSLNATAFDCTVVGDNVVTLTVTDNNGNSNSCTATVNIEDNVAPIALCQNLTVQLNGSGNATVAATQINNSSSDACGIGNLSLSQTSFTCANIGVNTVTLLVSDNNGNTSTCTASVTVQDNTPPSITCPADQAIPLGVNCETVMPNISPASASDNCSVTVVQSPLAGSTLSGTGPITVTLTATDQGNLTSTCSFTLTKEDHIAPSISCPSLPIEQNNDAGLCTAVVNFSSPASATDYCTASPVITYSPASGTTFAVGNTTVTATATDASNNAGTCTFVVTVKDAEAPTVICPTSSITQNADPGACNSAVSFSVSSSDNCDNNLTINLSQASGTMFPVGTNHVTYTATDDANNSASCSFAVIISDTQAPTVTCPANMTSDTDPNLCSAVVNFTATATDNCNASSAISYSPASGSVFALGETLVTATANDGNGNTATCNFTVTVNDNQAPTALCQDVTVQISALGNASVTAAQVNNGSSDACGIAGLTVSPKAFSCAAVGENTVTLTATDNNGNTGTCLATVTVLDLIAPVAQCQPLTVSLNGSGGATVTAAQVDDGTSDVCGIASLILSPMAFTCANLGANSVVLTATDNSGNTGSCTTTVTIQDNTAPSITCPANQNIPMGANCEAVMSNYIGLATAGDNCSIHVSQSPAAGSTLSGTGPVTVTLTATDQGNLASSCTFTLTKEDHIAPSIVCPSLPILQDNDGGQCNAVVQFASAATASDYCDASVTLAYSPASGTAFNVGNTTVTATATDDSGNTASCNFVVSVKDAEAPTVTCPAASIEQNADLNACNTTVTFSVTSSDNCDNNLTISLSQASGTVFLVGTTNVFYTATDDANNSTTCSFAVIITDTQAPTVTCPANRTSNTDPNLCSAVHNFTATATDNCNANPSITFSPVSGSAFGLGATTVTATAGDGNGNTATCSFTIAVNDTQKPTLSCPTGITQAAAAGICSAVVNFSVSATDNCNPSPTVTGSHSSGTFNVGTTTINYTANDGNGNTATCAFNVVVTDNQLPTITCPANIVQNNDANQCSAVVNYTVTASDNCAVTPAISYSKASGTVFQLGATTVTATASDGNGNTATCNFTVTVNDTEVPAIICPANITVNNTTNQCQAAVTVPAPTATDNCSTFGASVTTMKLYINGVLVSTATGGPQYVGSNPIAIGQHNGGGCNGDIKVDEVRIWNIARSASQIAGSMNNSLTGTELGLNSYYNCDQGTANGTNTGITALNDLAPFAGTNNGVLQNVALTGSVSNFTTGAPFAGSGNALALGSGNDMVIIGSPIPANSSYTKECWVFARQNGCDNILSSSNEPFWLNGAIKSGHAGNYGFISAPSSFPLNQWVHVALTFENGVTTGTINNNFNNTANASGTYPVGTTNVIWKATDASGNSSTCTQTVTVVDNQQPNLTCPATQSIVLNASCEATLGNYTGLATKSDNCTATANIVLTQTPASGTAISGFGPMNVVIMAQDAAGNQRTCNFTVNKLDQQAPTIACPANQIVALGNDCTVAMPNYTQAATTNDNCGAPTVTQSGGGTNRALDFDGVNDYLDLTSATNQLGNQATLEWWVKANAIPSDGRMWCPRGTTSSRLSVGTVEGSSGQIRIWSGNAYTNVNAYVTIGAWKHYALVRNSASTMSFYENGVLVHNNLPILSSNADFLNQQSIATQFVNNVNQTFGAYFPGQFDEVRVWNVARTGAEIATNLNSCLTGTEPGLIGLYHLDDGSGSAVTFDGAGANNQGVLINMDPASDWVAGASAVGCAGTFNGIQSKTVTLTATDVAGNTATCSFTVTSQDQTLPSINCPANQTVVLNASCQANVGNYAALTGVADNCATTITQSPANGTTVSGVGVQVVTMTATDISGNTASCVFNVNRVDNIDPVITTCPANRVVYLNGDCQVVFPDLRGEVVASDNCTASGSLSVIQGPIAGLTLSLAHGSTTTVNITVGDGNGNTDFCSVILTVQDNTAPTLTCPSDQTVEITANCAATLPDYTVSAVATDNCTTAGNITLSQSPTSVSLAGTQTVTITATDQAGNTSTCQFNVAKEDNTAPTAVCNNIIVELVDRNTYTLSATEIDAIASGSSDNCAFSYAITAGLTQYDCDNRNTKPLVTLTVTDASGNTATCTAKVLIIDPNSVCNEPPVAVCQDITVNLDADCTASIADDAVDNGSSDPDGDVLTYVVSPNNFSGVGTTTVTLTVSDGEFSDDCTATVTTVDVTAPMADIAILEDVVVECSVTLDPPTATDACDGAITATTSNPTTYSAQGIYTVTWTYTDTHGNTSSQTQTVIVDDNTPLVIKCPTTKTQVLGSNNCQTTLSSYIGMAITTDNCGSVTVTQSPAIGAVYNGEQSVAVTLTGTDIGANLASCTFNVEVQDNTNPTAVCQDVTVQLNAAGVGTLTASAVNNGSSDACGIAGTALNVTAFDCDDIGGNGNTQAITGTNNNGSQDWKGTLGSRFDVPSGPGIWITQLGAFDDAQNGITGIQTGGSIRVAIFNRTTQTVISGLDEYISGSGDPLVGKFRMKSITPVHLGAGQYMLVAQGFHSGEKNGNSVSSGTQSIKASVPGFITFSTEDFGPNVAGSFVYPTTPGAGANGPNYWHAGSFSFAESLGTNTVTLTVTDVNGNSSTCTANVTVEDHIAPVATCQNLTVQLNAAGTASTTAAAVNNGSSDACGIKGVTLNNASFTCANLGVNTVILTATDNNDNTATCTATITVQDNIAPTALCKNAIVALGPTGLGTITTASVNNGSYDNCFTNLALDVTSFDCDDALIGVSTVTLTVTDNSGNSHSCTATVTVEDNLNPVIVCPSGIQTVALGANCSTPMPDFEPALLNATDNCSYIVTQTPAPGTPINGALGMQFVHMAATDPGGLSAVCDILINVVDNTPPTAVCQNLTVVLNIDGDASISANMVNNGSSDGCGIYSKTISQTAFHCSHVGTNTVILTVKDVNNNTSTCTATITVEDNNLPTANCNNFVVHLNANGQASITTAMVNDGSWDACGIASATINQSAFDCTQVGVNTVTLTVTDINSNVSTCEAEISLLDVILPTTLCKNATVMLDADGEGAITVSDVNNGSYDNCGIYSLNASTNTFTCANTGNNTVVLTATDVNGNVNTCSAVVSVQDNTDPVALCQNVTVELNASGAGAITAAQVNDGSSDICGVQSLALSLSSFDCSQVGDHTAVLTVKDNNDNVSTCTATISVVDHVAPVAVCQDITLPLNSTGNASITVANINNNSSDACGIQSVTISASAFNCSQVGVNNVTLTVTDVNGNVSNCIGEVTVVDQIAATALCQNRTVALSAAGTAGVTAAQVNNGSSDNCGIQSLALSQTAFNCSHLGSNTVTLTVTDVNGNISTCISTITVQDNILPMALCKNLTLQLNAAGAVTITPADVNNGSSDNCGFVLSLNNSSFGCANVGLNTVTLTNTDAAGNTATCQASITVKDQVAPNPGCQNYTLALNAQGEGCATAANVAANASDACGISSIFYLQTVTDDNKVENGTFNYSNSYWQGQNIDWNGGWKSSGGNPGGYYSLNGTGSCSSDPTLKQTIDGLQTGKTYIISGDYRGSGNSTAASFGILVDNVLISQLPNPGAVWTHFAVTFTASDDDQQISFKGEMNCDGTDYSIDNIRVVKSNTISTMCFDCSHEDHGCDDDLQGGGNGGSTEDWDDDDDETLGLGNHLVTIIVTDNNGNTSSCSATISVVDNMAPVADCKNRIVNLNQYGQASITAASVEDDSYDNCGIDHISVNKTSFDCSNVGANTVILSVTDDSGNTGTCNAIVTVKDVHKPNIACLQNKILTLNANCQVVMPDYTSNASVWDNCSVVVTQTPAPGTLLTGSSSILVTLTATDPSGNNSSADFYLYMKDLTAPTAICKNKTVVLGSNGQVSITTADINNGSSDACGIQSLNISTSTFNCSKVGANTVTLTVTDVSGNVSTCVGVVTVVDNVMPTALCKNTTVSLNASGIATLTTAQVNNGSSDNCSIQNLALSQTAFNCSNLGSTTVTLTVTDFYQNISTCNATVTVVDNLKPVALCKNLTLTLNAAGAGTITTADINNGSSDNCGYVLSLNKTSFNCINVGANTVILTATDASGNTASCQAAVTVKDLTPPTALCKNATAVLGSNGEVLVTSQMINNGSSDVCGIQSLSVNPSTLNCSKVGANNVTLTVTDVGGNLSNCVGVVTVVDNLKPTALCKNATITLSSTGNATLTTAQVNNGSSDNCSIQSLALSKTAFNCSNVGSNTVTLTVTDVYQNTSTCNATITVQDNIKPVALCKNLTLQLNSVGAGTIAVADINNGSSDNCGFTLSLSKTSFNCLNVGSNTVTLTATDGSGNTASCQASVTVKDLTAPTAICKNVTVVLGSNGEGIVTPQMVNNGSSDACSISSMAIASNCNSSFNCEDVGLTFQVTLQVKDPAGNTSTCTSNVTISGGTVDTDCDGVADPCDQCPGGDDLVDNNHDGKPDCAYAPSYSSIISGWKCGNNKVYMCHTTSSNGNPTQTLCVSYSSVSSHLNHGDYIGYCGNSDCLVGGGPDGNKPHGGDDGHEHSDGRDEEHEDLGENAQDMLLFPNPTSNDVFIGLDGFMGKSVSLRLFDQMGKQLWVLELPEAQDEMVQLHLKELGLASGLYRVMLQSEGKTIVKQLAFTMDN